MSLPSAPPKYTSWAQLVSPIVEGETGWRPYALQRALTSLGFYAIADGDFGPDTALAVRAYQKTNGLVVDIIVGAKTQGRMLAQLGTRTHARLPGVPDGLMRGFAAGEGANVLAATNWTIAGGVDCGSMQFRIFGPPYDMALLRRRFDASLSMLDAGEGFLERAAVAFNGSWVRLQSHRTELSKRIAVLAHNWPAGAEAYARTGSCSRPSELATWVAPGTKFPDGVAVRTRLDWCQFYAMSGPHGEGAITQYVADWS